MHVFEWRHTEPTSDSLCEYLRLSQVNYHMIDLLDNQSALDQMAPHSALVRSVLLQDDAGPIMAIIPQAGLLDLGLLHHQTRRDLVGASKQYLKGLDLISSPKNCPPLSEYFGLSSIIDPDILSMETIYFRVGKSNILIGMHRDAFMQLQHNPHFGAICIPMEHLLNQTDPTQANHSIITQLTPIRMKQRIQKSLHLPVMPAVIGQLLQCRLEHARCLTDMVDIIKSDPSLSLQVLSWVQPTRHQPMLRLKTIEDAIAKMLGYDLTLNLSLMTALSDPLKMPKSGKLGWQAYWRSALHVATLSQTLAKIIAPRMDEKQQMAYLSGLFHNIGLVILSEMFPSYYALLTQLMKINNHLSLSMIEQHAFGLTHHQLSAWMMEAWVLPQEMIAGSHWFEIQHQSANSEQAKIVRLAAHLLAEEHIVEETIILPKKELCAALGLSQEQAEFALAKSLSNEYAINRIIQ